MSSITIAEPTAALVFDEPTLWTDRSLPTASWWDEYEIQPGTYAFEWVTISNTPWNADPQAVTSGFLGNTGPYYGLVTMQARLLREYRENRLLSECRADLREAPNAPVRTLRRSLYAYSLPGYLDVMDELRGPSKSRTQRYVPESFLGGRVVRL